MTKIEKFAHNEAGRIMEAFAFSVIPDSLELKSNEVIQGAMAEAFLCGAMCGGMDSDVFKGAMKHFEDKEQ